MDGIEWWLVGYATALRELRPLAEEGLAGAQNHVGLMYGKGQGVGQDHADAQHNLGIMYANGQGVPQDYVAAHMWWNLAAVQGLEDAAKNRDIVAGRMTPAQIAEAKRLAREWKQ